MIKQLIRWLAAISIIGFAMVGIVLILIAILYPTPPHAVLWYMEGGKVYRFDTKTRKTEEVMLPAKGRIVMAKLNQDGNKIAFTDNEGLKISTQPFTGYDLAIATKTETSGPMTASLRYVPQEWSPDNSQLVVAAWSVDLYSLHVLSLLDHSMVPVQSSCISISWASDSQRVACADLQASMVGGEGGVFVISSIDSSAHRIYYDSNDEFDHGVASVNWAPASEEILFVNPDFSDVLEHRSALSIVNATTGEVKTLIEVQIDKVNSPVWSIEGDKVYYVVRRDDENDELNVFNLKSKIVTNLLSTSDLALLASPSPDGKWLVVGEFDIQSNNVVTRDELKILNLVSLEYIRVVPSDNTGSFSFVGWQMVP